MNARERLREVFLRGWRVTDDGVAMRHDGQPQKVLPDVDGYLRFSVKFSDGVISAVKVHRLAAYQRFGDAVFEPGVEVRHLNGETDNRAGQIVLGTKHDNAMDKPAAVRLRMARGAALKLRKLSQEQVQRLRAERSAGAKYAELCAKYGLSKSAVSYIVNGRTYAAAQPE